MNSNAAANVVGLREIAQRLKATNLRQRSKTAGRRELLNLLQAGRLTAKVRFPSVSMPQFPVPREHWEQVTIGQFQKALERRRSRTGDYVIPAHVFRAAFVAWHEETKAGSSELFSALGSVGQDVEVYILETDWEKFAADEGLYERRVMSRSRSAAGAHETVKWAEVLTEAAAVLMVRPGLTNTEIAAQALDTVALEDQAPTKENLAKKIGEIRKKAKAMRARS